MIGKIFKVIKTILEVLSVFGILRKNAQLKKSLDTVIVGVENFSRAEGNEEKGKRLKGIIKEIAVSTGADAKLKKYVKDAENRLWKKLFPKD